MVNLPKRALQPCVQYEKLMLMNMPSHAKYCTLLMFCYDSVGAFKKRLSGLSENRLIPSIRQWRSDHLWPSSFVALVCGPILPCAALVSLALVCSGLSWSVWVCPVLPWSALACVGLPWLACPGLPWSALVCLGLPRSALSCLGWPCPPCPCLPCLLWYASVCSGPPWLCASVD